MRRTPVLDATSYQSGHDLIKCRVINTKAIVEGRELTLSLIKVKSQVVTHIDG
jgi:hypothetical protein